MATIQIIGKANVNTRAVIYEPRQSPTQEEVVLDTIDLAPGEVRPYEARSNTIAYRLEDAPGGPIEEAKPAPDQAPDPKNGLPPDTSTEMQAGKERLDGIERRQKAVEARAGQPRMATSETAKAAGVTPQAAVQKTEGQKPAEAANPSTNAGTTGQADTGKEVKTGQQAAKEAPVAPAKSSTPASKPAPAPNK